MPSIHEAAWLNLEAILKEELPIKTAWQKLIDYHADANPKQYWSLIKTLDVGTEQEKINEWFEHTITNIPLTKNIIALWIGITKLWDDDNDREFYAIYITGSDSYNTVDVDWAVQPLYDPEEKYIVLNVLNTIDEILKTDEDDYGFNDWIVPIAYCSLTISDIIRTKLDKITFKNLKNLFVSFGYDGGDFIAIKPIN